MGRYFSAGEIEPRIWALVRDTLFDPNRPEAALTALEREDDPTSADSQEKALEVAQRRAAELEKRRGGYIDLAADGVMDCEELAGKLSVLEDERPKIKRKIDEMLADRAKVERLRRDSKRTLAAMRDAAPDALDSLTGEERRKLYKTLDLSVEAFKTRPGRG